MELTDLASRLTAAATGTNIQQVVFDYASYVTYGDKAYPLALWDINNMEGTADLRDGKKLIQIYLWVIAATTPESDVSDRLTVWTAIETDTIAYLQSVAQQADITIENVAAMPFAYFPAGLLSLEREMAVRYRVNLKDWCPTPPGD